MHATGLEIGGAHHLHDIPFRGGRLPDIRSNIVTHHQLPFSRTKGFTTLPNLSPLPIPHWSAHAKVAIGQTRFLLVTKESDGPESPGTARARTLRPGEAAAGRTGAPVANLNEGWTWTDVEGRD